jgi:hypothetical protein
MSEVRVDLGTYDLLVVEALIDAYEQLEDPEPIVKLVVATWKTRMLLDARHAEIAQEQRNLRKPSAYTFRNAY